MQFHMLIDFYETDGKQGFYGKHVDILVFFLKCMISKNSSPHEYFYLSKRVPRVKEGSWKLQGT